MIKLDKKTYKAAVIGVGRIGMKLELDPKRLKPATHFGMWHSNSETNLVAVCDPVQEHLEIAKGLKKDILTFSSAEDLLRTVKPDIVSICTWKDTHYEMMKLCSKYEVPAIVCEKPIAEKSEHAKEVVDELNNKGIHLFINHRRRFDELLYPFIDHLKSGLIGELIQVNAHYVFGLVTTGTHLVDALRFFFNAIAGEVKWVVGFQNKFKCYSPDDDPCIDFVMCFENGLKVFVQSLNIKDYDIFNVHIYGREGKATFKNIGRDIEIRTVIESPEHHGFTELSNELDQSYGDSKPRDQFGFLAKNVVESLRGKASSLSSGEESLKALDILLAIEQSVKKDSIKINI